MFAPNLVGGLKTTSFVKREEDLENKEHLRNDARHAVKILTRLTTRDKEGKATLPKAVIKGSQGLAVVVQTKAGLGVGVCYGSGFVIGRLGPEEWSAPSFFTINKVSAGLTFGFHKLETLVCIRDQVALEKFKERQLVLGTDVTLTAGKDLATNAEGAADATTFTLIDGVGVDFSLRGGVLHLDKATNKALYGQGATPEALFIGEVPAPPEFAPLLQALVKLEAEDGDPLGEGKGGGQAEGQGQAVWEAKQQEGGEGQAEAAPK